MKTRNSAKKSLIILLIFLGVACGSEDDSSGTIYYALFDAEWPVKDDPDRKIDLRSNNLNSESGTLTGKETIVKFDEVNSEFIREENSITGSFKGLKIDITIAKAKGSVKCSGTMVPVSETNHQIVKINLKSSSGEELILGL